MSTGELAKTVSVVGLGYIGLPTAAAFATWGVKVIGVDTNPRTVTAINHGCTYLVEPGLDEAVHRAVENGFLRATLAPEPASAFIIAVPTPFQQNHEPDLSFIEAATRAVAPVLRPGNLIILESTSPVGATERMADWFAEMRPDLTFPQQRGAGSDIRIAHCPERVLPGRALQELVGNDRVIGGMTPRCGAAAKALYEIFVEGECLLTDARTAEMCKLAENAFRDVNIAYANELSLICDKLRIDVRELVRLANRHPRVKILQPGTGVGGHCIAVDPWFIVASAPEQTRLIRTAREVNDSKPEWVLAKVEEEVRRFSELHGGIEPKIAVLGLAFKPNIDDLRESPALYVAERLCRAHAERLMIVEPHTREIPKELTGCRVATIAEAEDEADILLILVSHKIFQQQLARRPRPDQRFIDVAGLFADQMETTSREPALQMHAIPAD